MKYAEEHGKYLYTYKVLRSNVMNEMSDEQIRDMRVRAFVDGCKWMKHRLARKARRVVRGDVGSPK